MMLDDEETEDPAFLYLQSLGWYVIPNSRKADSMSFEYFAVNPKNGEKALTQVKAGNVSLNKDDYAQSSDKIFLFQSNGLYEGGNQNNVICITRNELQNFLKKALSWLPAVFKTKSEMIESQYCSMIS